MHCMQIDKVVPCFTNSRKKRGHTIVMVVNFKFAAMVKICSISFISLI